MTHNVQNHNFVCKYLAYSLSTVFFKNDEYQIEFSNLNVNDSTLHMNGQWC
jgi:cell division protein FtsL